VDAALRFLSDAFGFEVSVRWEEAGVVQHAEITWSGSTVMLGTGDDQTAPVTERSVGHRICVVVEDVEEHFKRARKAGAHVVFPPEDTPWGTRRFRVLDIEGHEWSFGSYQPGQ
jgi:uncharacterized glyoxalase superfamily protein PhnB